MRTSLFSILSFTILGCGGGGGGDTPSADAPAADTAMSTQDGPPACTPAIPDKVAIAAGGSEMPMYTGLTTLTSTGRIAVLFADTVQGGVAARVWDNGAWTTRSVFTNTNGGIGNMGAGEIDGRPVVLANVFDQSSDSGKLRAWVQLPDGSFAAGTRVTNAAGVDAPFTRYSPATHVLSAAGADFSGTLYSYEVGSAGTWTVQTVALVQPPGTIRSAGVGAFADGTAAVAGMSANGLVLYRRNGTTWTSYKTLAGGNITTGFVGFPPASGPSGIAVWLDPTTQHPRGAVFSTTDGTPGGGTDLVTHAIGSYFMAEIVFDDTGTAGKILLVDDNNQTPHAYIASFQGSSFVAAAELRPDLVFEAAPHLVYHPCGGFMIMHVTRTAADASGSAPAVIEPLATFWPGH